MEKLQLLQQDISAEAHAAVYRSAGLNLLLKKAVAEEDLFLCRAWLQAPEVDGLTVYCMLKRAALKPGDRVTALR